MSLLTHLLEDYPDMKPLPKTAFELPVNTADPSWTRQCARVNVQESGDSRRYLLRLEATCALYSSQELLMSDAELDAVLGVLVAARDAERKGGG